MKIKTITSSSNPEIQNVAQLARSKKDRTEQKLFVAEGLRACSTLIQSGIRISMLYATDDQLQVAKKLVSQYALTCVREIIMKKMSTATTPSGILGVFEMPAVSRFDKLSGGIVLAQIADPGNMGTLIRSAAAMKVPSVVVIEGADVLSPKVIQATAGTIGQVHILQCPWQELRTHARKNNLSLCALVVSDGEKPSEINFKKSLLVVGSEAHGIPDEWLAECDQQLTIPMPGGVESLNAAVAGSIALYLGYGSRY